ncbi:hypothetical protein J6590_025908 [Homalodisca vitripennis]|nr:hypothetical protein J6590_025908 [Homalodisca vitripennis]
MKFKLVQTGNASRDLLYGSFNAKTDQIYSALTNSTDWTQRNLLSGLVTNYQHSETSCLRIRSRAYITSTLKPDTQDKRMSDRLPIIGVRSICGLFHMSCHGSLFALCEAGAKP